jgi:hypothetical protein
MRQKEPAPEAPVFLCPQSPSALIQYLVFYSSLSLSADPVRLEFSEA